jgi:hypothetical protein
MFNTGAPRCVRMDRGTENILIEDIQKAIRWEHFDDMAGAESVLYGSSHRNQVGLRDKRHAGMLKLFYGI